MSHAPYKLIGVISLVVCAISVFVAWERYQHNAAQVAAANQMMQGFPMGGMMQHMTGGAELQLQPAMPTSAKYAIAIALLSGIAGVVCLMMPSGADGRKSKLRSPEPEAFPSGIAAGPSTAESLKELEGRS